MDSAKILIVEDEILIAEDIKGTLKSFGFSNVSMAHDLAGALKMIESFQPQVVLLDVHLENERDGILIGEQLARDNTAHFIYITAHSDVEMVKEIIRTNPVGYITKPVKRSDLFASVMLAITKYQTLRKEEQVVHIKDGYETVLIPLSSIRYIEAEGNYLNIYCEEKRYVVRQSLDAFLLELNNDVFFRIHRSFAVNIQKVIRYSKKEIVLAKDIVLPISRTIKAEFEVFMTNRKV